MDISSGFDKAWMLKQIGGDLALLHEVAKVFLDDALRLQQQIAQAHQEQNSEALYAAAHAMKSAVGNFGAKAAVDTAQALEKACRSKDTEAYPPLVEALLHEVTELSHALTIELEQNA